MYIIKSTNIENLNRVDPFEIKSRTAEETAIICKNMQLSNIGYIVLYQKEEKWITWIMEWNQRKHSFNNLFTIPEEFYKLLDGGLIPFDEDPEEEEEKNERS